MERRSLRHRRGLQHAVAFEAKVVMQARRRMVLDEEQRRTRASRALGARRLRSGAERALGRIFAELAFAHGGWTTTCRSHSALIPVSLRAGEFMRGECTLPRSC